MAMSEVRIGLQCGDPLHMGLAWIDPQATQREQGTSAFRYHPFMRSDMIDRVGLLEFPHGRLDFRNGGVKTKAIGVDVCLNSRIMHNRTNCIMRQERSIKLLDEPYRLR